jgi:hypothetical protein
VQLTSAQVELLGARKAIAVNMPTRWAVQFHVAETVHASKIAFIAATITPAREMLGGKADEARKIVSGECGPFWQELETLLSLLRPFEQAIHQLEGDRPHLADCHIALLWLQRHVEKLAAKHEIIDFANKDNKGVESACNKVVQTFMLRLGIMPGGMSAPVNNPAYSVAYALGPFYAELDESAIVSHFTAPMLSSDHMNKARALIKRVGGVAVGQFNKLFTDGYPSEMQPFLAEMVSSRDAPVGEKRKAKPSAPQRMNVWENFGAEMPELCQVALRMLCCHASSAATECNWSLWGKIYTAVRSSLGMNKAKAMIRICAAKGHKVSEQKSLALTLDVLEDDA